jgi:hypothetical protein
VLVAACSSSTPDSSTASSARRSTPRAGVMRMLAATGGALGPSGPSEARGADPAQAAGFIPPNVPPINPPQVPYNGGRVISNAQIVQVDWNSSGTFETYVTDGEMASFYAGITNSRYFDWLSEYNGYRAVAVDGNRGSTQVIGRGTFGGRFDITPSVTSTTLTDAQIQGELRAQIAAGTLPAPTADFLHNTNTIYFIHFPKGTSVDLDGSLSCQDFCAYHGTVAATPDGTSPELYYAVMPDFSVGSNCETCEVGITPFQLATTIASHELVEAVTDPEIGIVTITTDDAGVLQSIRPAAWYDPNPADLVRGLGGEVGDICRASSNPTLVDDDEGTAWMVQREWSNQANDCVVSHLANGSFEGRAIPSLNGWKTVGAAPTDGGRTGLGRMILGIPSSNTTPSGTSNASQTFDIPDDPALFGGNTMTLSFWYEEVCGSLSSGWLTASLTDVATGTAVTVLPLTCTTSTGWTQASADVTRFHGRTVTLSITNEDASGSVRTTSLIDDASVVLNPASTTNPVLNPSFEKADYSVSPPLIRLWSVAGTASFASIFTQPVFTGRHAAMTGSTSATSGDSSLFQTVTVPSGASAITLWYLPFCQDPANDWVTVTLQDHTSGTSTAILPPTCESNVNVDHPLWTLATGAVVAGHTYTITLTSHDDAAPATPTYAFWDDVNIQ